MALSPILLLGVATALFVGTNIGGSSTGVAFGPATGSGMLSMRQASALMAVFVLLGGVTVGRNVVHTLGEGFVPPEYFSPLASIGVLLFIGLGILLGNVLKVSVSTSETVLFVGGFGYLVFRVDPRVAAFEGGLVVGYLLRIWERMAIYERILEEAVSHEAETQVAAEVEQQVVDEVATEVEQQVADEVVSEIEQQVEAEMAESESLTDDRLAEGSE